jgi:AraC-like DNA-binding protein
MLTMKQEDFQRQFFRNAGPNIKILRQMADSMPDVLFNIVDGENRVVAFNKANCANCNFRDESEIVGRRIEDAFPAVLADAYMSLYAEVRETGVPVRDRLCAHGADRSTELRVANVFPVRNGKGKIIGTATFYRPVSNGDITPEWYGALKKAIAYVDAHYSEKIPLSTLAATAGMGSSTFRRVFTDRLSISPGEYISTIRINHARKLLAETSLTVEQIAAECGFFDQSHMTKIFKSLRRVTPGEYRRRHRTQTEA